MSKISPFVKSPEHLKKLTFGTELGRLLKTTELKLDVNFLPKPVDVWVKRKKNPSIQEQLSLQHRGTVSWCTTNQTLTFENTAYLSKNPKADSSQTHKKYTVTIPLLNNEAVIAQQKYMLSEDGYKAGTLLHGLASLLYKELEQLFNVPVPYTFKSTLPAAPFHLGCGAILTYLNDQMEIITAVRNGLQETDLTHPNFLPNLQEKLSTINSRAVADSQTPLLQNLLNKFTNKKGNVNYALVVPLAAREQLEATFKQALTPPNK